jgi:chromosome partitioning protein
MQLSAVTQAAEELLTKIRNAGIAPNQHKELARRFNGVEVSALVGRTPSHVTRTIAEMEKEGVCPPFHEEGRYRYEMTHVEALRDRFGSHPCRDSEIDEPVVLAVQNFKGGVGKTTLALNLAQYLAMKGYRVLLVDMDSQASATASFGIIPDVELAPEDTILPFFDGVQDDLGYCIRPTHWPGLDLIPTNLASFDMEWGVAKQLMDADNPEERDFWTSRLRDGIDTVSDAYDVVIIDSPPSLGTTSMNILRAVDGLVIPTPAKLLDFASTVQYLRLVSDLSHRLGVDDHFKFISIVNTLYEGRDKASKEARSKSDDPVSPNMQMQIRMLMHELFQSGGFLVETPFRKMAEIENAAAAFSTVLEERRPLKSASEIIQGVCENIELNILKCWPSKAKEAHKLGKKLGISVSEEQDD